MRLFVDASALVARFDPEHRLHDEFRSAWRLLHQRIQTGRELELVTTPGVIGEVCTYLAREIDYERASEIGAAMYASRWLTVVRPEPRDEAKALKDWPRFPRHRNKQLSFVDCVSFQIMNRLGLKDAFTDDADFSLAGFTLWPRHREP